VKASWRPHDSGGIAPLPVWIVDGGRGALRRLVRHHAPDRHPRRLGLRGEVGGHGERQLGAGRRSGPKDSGSRSLQSLASHQAILGLVCRPLRMLDRSSTQPVVTRGELFASPRRTPAEGRGSTPAGETGYPSGRPVRTRARQPRTRSNPLRVRPSTRRRDTVAAWTGVRRVHRKHSS
jgi:hypothetical protein